MKIIYITSASVLDTWAHSVQIVNMCKAFSDNGAEVVLVSPHRKIFDGIDLFDKYKIQKNFSVKFLPCIDLFPGSSSSLLYLIKFISFYISAKIYILSENFDLLYSRDLYSPIFFKNIVLEQHTFPGKNNFFLRYVFTKNRKVVALTSFIKKRFVEKGLDENNIIVSPSGVNLDNFKMGINKIKIDGINDNDFVFGYIGTLKTMGMEKGVHDCLVALSILNNNYKFLVVGGEKIDIDYYKNISNELGVFDRVVFVGKVPYNDVPKYSSLCDILVAPFPKNEHYSFFMSPLKIFEYMASKKPIIATNLPSIKEVLTDGVNSVLIEPCNSKALFGAIVKIKENPDFGRKIADEAYNNVINYSWSKRSIKIIDFLKL